MYNNKHLVFLLNNEKINSIDIKDDSVNISDSISQPKISMGFHSFLHRTKNAMVITKKLETTKQFYYIVNPFEEKIDNYEDDLVKKSKLFFDVKTDEINFNNKTFYQMWEMLYIFDICNKNNMNIGILSDNMNGFLQAILHFRKKYKYDIKNDKIYINSDKTTYNNSKNFMGYYKKEFPKRIKLYKESLRKTSRKNSKSHTNKDVSDKDLSNKDVSNKVKTVKSFFDDVKNNTLDLVCCNYNYEATDKNYEEQEIYMLLLRDIINSLKILNKDGNLILKINECMTTITNKFLYLLSMLFEETYIYKPFLSRLSDSERFLVCKKFKSPYNTKILEQILKKMETKLFVNDILFDINVPEIFLNKMKYINTFLANQQQILINKIVLYIKGNNYFGEEYHNYRDVSIKAIKWWESLFFTDKINNDKFKEDINYNNKEMILFVNKIK
jgi:hypothetical protein